MPYGIDESDPSLQVDADKVPFASQSSFYITPITFDPLCLDTY